MTDTNEGDIFAAMILGFSVRIFSIVHDVTAPMGYEPPLLIAALIALGIGIALSLMEEKQP